MTREDFGFHQWYEIYVLLRKAVDTLESAHINFENSDVMLIQEGTSMVTDAAQMIKRGAGIGRMIEPDEVELMRVIITLKEFIDENRVEEKIDALESYFAAEEWRTGWAKRLGREILTEIRRWQAMAGDNRRRKPDALLELMIQKIRRRVKKHD